MSDTQPQNSKTSGPRPNERRGTHTFYVGNESFFPFFTQAQVNVNGLRMTFDEEIAQPVGDLASRIESIRRKLLHDGNVVSAIEQVRKVGTSLDQRIQAWEGEAQRREKNKTKMSGEGIQKMNAEFSRVRMKYQLSRRTVTKLLIELHQLSAGGPFEEDLEFDLPSRQRSAEEIAAARKKRSESIEIVNPILQALIHDELRLNSPSARFSVGSYPKGKEEAWDLELNAFLVVGWYLSLRTHRSGNNLDLDVWLIPKEPKTCAALALLAPEIKIDLRTPGEMPNPLEFFAMSAMDDVLPRSEQLNHFVSLIKQKNFADTPLGLKVLRARMAFAAQEDFFQTLEFKPLK